MRFVAKQPKEGVNVSKTHPLAEASLLVVGLGILFTLLAILLVFLVEFSLRFVSIEQEAAIFADWMPDDIATVAPDDERLIATQLLVDRLASWWPESPYEFRIEIDDSEASNAMALPGGLIIVTSGLLQQVESENELALVLGHELGHYHNRDHLRALGRGVSVALVFAVITGGDAGSIGLAAADLALRGFSRKQESHADAFALQLVNAEYGHVRQAWRLFERWHSTPGRDYPIAYLSTHPPTGERIDDLRELVEKNAWATTGAVSPLSW